MGISSTVTWAATWAATWAGGVLAAAAGCCAAAQSPAARLEPRQGPRNVALHAPNKAGQKVTYVTFWPLASFWPAGLAPFLQTPDTCAPRPRRGLAAGTERWGGRRRRSGRAAAARVQQLRSSAGAVRQPAPTAALRHRLTTSVLCTRYSGTLPGAARRAAGGWTRRAAAARRGRAAAGRWGQRRACRCGKAGWAAAGCLLLRDV